MKIEDAVESMSKQYLGRVLDSFTRDLAPLDESEMREYIARNAEELAKSDHIRTKLDLFDMNHSDRVLAQFVIEAMINVDDCVATERELAESVRTREEALLDEARTDDALRYADEHAAELLGTVLEVAFEDGEISRDEYKLIRRLREKLQISRKQQRILEAQLGMFPQHDSTPHTHDQIRNSVKELERRGILFYCNRTPDGSKVVLPEELQGPVKSVFDIELSDAARHKLWGNLSKAQLQTVLRTNNMMVSGAKDELVDRLMRGEIPPSQGLDELMNDALYELCSSLPGVHVSGTKQERIDRIIRHFDRLSIREVDPDAHPGAQYYEYFVELAARDRENLYANDVITKDLDIEHAFEEATTWLFNEKLGVETGEFEGSDHPDGVARFRDDTLFYWDNKSKESVYDFPSSHVRQFKRYIRDSADRVNCFMVIVPELDEEAVDPTCLRTKYESQSDTDVCVVTAEDLKWVAETWTDFTSCDDFDLNVFNQTGVLSRRKLEQSMKLLL